MMNNIKRKEHIDSMKSVDANTKKNDATNNKVIVQYQGSNYDITDFVKKHPGGKKVLLENNGKDIEQIMAENEHSDHAYTILAKYKIN